MINHPQGRGDALMIGILVFVAIFILSIVWAANSFKASESPETLELKKFTSRHQILLDARKG